MNHHRSYGAVFKALHKKSGTLVAIKEIPVNPGDTSLKDITKEICMLKQCNNPNVVMYFG